jgi:TRAP-type mannitol/chloroaromatic compound transport system permease small subunit
MTHAATSRRSLLIAVAGAILLLGAVAAIVVWDPVGSLVRELDLPSVSDLPDLPRWLLWALGKVKFAVIAVVALVVVVRELRRTRGA